MNNFEFDPTVSLSLLMSVGVFVFTWFKTRGKDLDEKFEKISSEFMTRDARLDNGSRRMTTLEMRQQATEQALENLPGKDHLHRLEVALAEIGGDLKAMNASMNSLAESQKRTEKIVSDHEGHLRENT